MCYPRKKLHEKIVEFFGSLKYGHTSHFRSIEEYEREKSQIILQAQYKSFISRFQVLCENTLFSTCNKTKN